MQAPFIQQMDDGHLIAAVRTEIDPLTSTPLELELLSRFEVLVDQHQEAASVVALLDEFEADADDLRAVIESHPASLEEFAEILAALNDAEIHTHEQLLAVIDTARQFEAIAHDAGDAFTRIARLITTFQE